MTPEHVRALHDRFFALGGPPTPKSRAWQFRRRCTSLRLPGCQLLADLVIAHRPARVLDLGSGMTTIILRELQKEQDDMLVVTTDTSTRWLRTTEAELVRDQLRTDHCFEQDAFIAATWEPFDLVSVDCDNLAYRLSIVPLLVQWCAPRGILVLDDFGMESYAADMTAALSAHGFTITEHHDTHDEYDTWLATAERAEP